VAVSRQEPAAVPVAHAHVQLHGLTEGTRVVPDFAHAVRCHRFLDEVRQAAARSW
jgi:hypothetical protein